MKFRILSLISITLLSACSQTPFVADIPPRPIVEEQDTPFAFKQAYQVDGLYSTQMVVTNDNDFVDIEASEQYVWWPAQATSDLTAGVRVGEVAQHDDDDENGAADSGATVMPATPLKVHGEVAMIEGNACGQILCEQGEPCGAIFICDGQICNDMKRDDYKCLDDACSTMQALHIIEVAKGESACSHYPERDICPQYSACKQKMKGARTRVSVEVVEALIDSEE